MAGGHEHVAGKLPQLLPVQVLILEHFHVIGFVEGLTPYDPQVKGLGGHAAYGILGVGLLIAEADAGKCPHVLQVICKRIGNIGGPGHTQTDLQGALAVLDAQGFDLLLLDQDGFGVAQKLFPPFGGNHTAAGPIKDGTSQIPLQLPDYFA